MATGKIKNWIANKGFGFIADGAGTSGDIFFHINNSPELKNKEGDIVPGASVVFDNRPSKRKPGSFEAYNVRLQETVQQTMDAEASIGESDDYFHNPYTFVPTPPRPSSGFAGDFNPLENGLDHASLKSNLWTGHIPIKLTTVTPLVLLKGDSEDRTTETHQTYDVLDYLPESSLRGMLRSAYEVVTNSRYGCFGREHQEKLAYRMDSRDAPQLIPAIIKNGDEPGKLVAQLCAGTSVPTPAGPKENGTYEEGAMYAAMFDPYNGTELYKECDSGYTPKTGQEVWAQIVLCEHRRNNRVNYLYWKALKVWSTDTHPNEPIEAELEGIPNSSLYTDINNPIERIVKGHVLITNKNIRNKHDERIFFYDNDELDLSDKDVTNLKEDWSKLIKNYRDAHSKDEIFHREDRRDNSVEAWEKFGNNPGETAWSPHLYQDSKHRDVWREDPHGRDTEHDAIDLKHGDMVYASCEFDNGEISKITHLLPVSISRVLYDLSPRDLLHRSLRPAKRISELSSADRLFGWVAQPDGEDSDQESRTKVQDQERDSYKGRIRVVCDNGPRPNIIERFKDDQSLPLAILGQPKPEQARFYVARDDKGTPQKDKISKKGAGYSKGKRLRGRKQYWHHKGLEADKAKAYWHPSAENRTQEKHNDRYQEYRRPNEGGKKNGKPKSDSQNRFINGWIAPSTEFKVSLYVQNLEPQEVGALLWLLSLNDGIPGGDAQHYYRLGYGKPLGFGSVKMEIDCQNECLPLGTGEDWKKYYTAFDADTSPPAALNQKRQENCRQKFQKSMVDAYHKDSDEFDSLSFIKEFRQVLKGPETGDPIHYPRTNRNQDPEGKNFEWFTQNERNRDSKLALPAATKDKGLPYKR